MLTEKLQLVFLPKKCSELNFVSRSGELIDLQGLLADLQEFSLHEPGMKCTAK